MAKHKEQKTVNKSPTIILAVVVVVCIALGFLAGWLAKQGEITRKNNQNRIAALRLDNYKLIKPLLACDTEHELQSPIHKSLENRVSSLIDSEAEKGHISTASVYIRDYDGGYTVNVNPDEKYYPASLSKVPMAMTAYQMNAEDPGFLDQKQLYDDPVDRNVVEVKPSDYLKNGQTYSIDEAINMLIVNSDNNAFFWLTKFVDQQKYTDMFNQLKIPARSGGGLNVSEDYMTAKKYSYFLRVLYNSTYLDYDLSEKMMETLSRVEYKNGLVAGLPQGVVVAHKFGIQTEGENASKRELHDCGIVYPENKKPYLICVMSKGTSSLENQEKVIQEISRLTYQQLRQ